MATGTGRLEKEACGRGDGVWDSEEEGDSASFGAACTIALLNRPVSSSPLLPSLSLVALGRATGRTPMVAALISTEIKLLFAKELCCE